MFVSGGTELKTLTDCEPSWLYAHVRLLERALNIKPDRQGAALSESFVVVEPVGDFKLLLCHGNLMLKRP